MCGIFGILAAPAQLPTRQRAEAALAMLAHRGPDARRLLYRDDVGVVLGHARLSILDVDARSDQPFVAPGCVLVFNGEIYNYRQLRAELERDGVQFHTTGDTEVIAAGYGRWGEGVFGRLRGMFAIALWDERERRLHLVRDEFGIKPLCILQRGAQVFFASEVKAIRALQPLGIDAGVLCEAWSWGFQLQDRSLFADVQFLPPGTQLSLQLQADGSLQQRARVVWRTRQAWHEAVAEPTAAQLRDVVERSVHDHLLADVPVAAALSGGLDSSIVTAVAAGQLPQLHAYTFTLRDGEDAEVEHAALLRRQLGLRHHIAHLTSADVTDWLRAVAWHLEEPIANINALPGFALAAAMRRHHCKVVLVGEGADELFGGYPWHRLALEPALANDPGALFDTYRRRRAQVALGQCLRPATQRLGEERLQATRSAYVERAAELAPDALAGFLSFDLDTQLQYSQLLRVDRMFMAHGIEARVPVLYRSVLLASAALPAARKVLPATGPGRREKVALGEAFAGVLPPRIAARPKFGAQGTVDIWGSWLAKGIEQAFTRCLHSAELRDARQCLDEHVDWAKLAAAPLSPKDRFAVALLLECADGVLSARPRPDAIPTLPLSMQDVDSPANQP